MQVAVLLYRPTTSMSANGGEAVMTWYTQNVGMPSCHKFGHVGHMTYVDVGLSDPGLKQ